MDISYIHTQKRKEFGRPCSFTEIGPELIVDIEPNPDVKNRFYVVPSVDREVDNTMKFCAQEINTISFPTESRGMNHVEGGWPAGIEIEDEDGMARFRKKIEKDKNYVHAVKNMGDMVENFIMENNSIDIYEEYFSGECTKDTNEGLFQILNVVCDLNETPRKVVDVSWSTDSTKIAGAYSLAGIKCSIGNTSMDSYVWDLGSGSRPYCVLKPESYLNCVEFSPTELNLLLGGYTSGQVAVWDMRVGGHAQQLSSVKESHTQKVTGTKWIKTNSRMHFFSASTDGVLMVWDARNLSESTEMVHMDLELDEVPNMDQSYTISCVEYGANRPNDLLLGTEQGNILSFTRECENRYDCQCGPILNIERNAFHTELFASCDPWTAKIWSEKNIESPVLNLISQDGYYTDIAWSSTRASLLLLTKTTGTVEVWDVPGKHLHPMASIPLGKDPLYSISMNRSGHELACGTASGSIHILEVPEQFKKSSEIQISFIEKSIGSVKERIDSLENADYIRKEFEKLFKT